MLASIIRTGVPIIVGYFLGWPVTRWLELTDDQVTALVTAVVTGGYYVTARALETYVTPQFGWLLGLAKQPAYPVDVAAPADATTRPSDFGLSAVEFLLGVTLVVVVLILFGVGANAT